MSLGGRVSVRHGIWVGGLSVQIFEHSNIRGSLIIGLVGFSSRLVHRREMFPSIKGILALGSNFRLLLVGRKREIRLAMLYPAGFRRRRDANPVFTDTSVGKLSD